MMRLCANRSCPCHSLAPGSTRPCDFALPQKVSHIIYPALHSAGLKRTSRDMAPIRRYLRITKYSVLEVRVYLVSCGCATADQGC